MNRLHIEQQLAALETEQRGILAKLAAGELTDELTAKDKSNRETIADLAHRLSVMTDAEQRLAAFKPTVPSGGEGGSRHVTVHDNAEDKPFAGVGDFLKAVAGSNHQALSDADPRLRKLASGQNTAVDSEGGFLVGTDIASEIFRVVQTDSQIAGRCREYNITGGSNAIEIPTVEETSRATGSRNGGARVYWAGEAGTVNPSLVKVGKERIELQKMMALMYVTAENLQDAGVLANLVRDLASEEMSYNLDDAILFGDGVGKPLGIFNSAALVTQAKEGSQSNFTINFQNIVKMWSRVLSRCKTRGFWIINSEAMPQLQQLASTVTNANELIYMPPGGLSVAPYGTLLGRPIQEIEQASALGTVGDIAFIDPTMYALPRKGSVVAAESVHVRFLNDESTFRFTYRVNGRPLPKAAITPAKGSATKSAFVALENRS